MTEREIAHCGHCANWEKNPDAGEHDWEGTCTIWDIGRSYYTTACDNPNAYELKSEDNDDA